MPSASRETASQVEDMGVVEGRYEELGGYTVGFETFREHADATRLFRGLPDDRCQSPHWGYVIAGQVTFKYADRDEVHTAGTAYYAPPGHVPVIEAGTEIVEFSPTGEYRQTMAVVAANLAALQA
jgi:hypothetical protein